MSRFRIERDAFGEVEVPADRYWGGQTQRALKLFDFGTETLPVRVVRVFGLQKMAALRANRRLNQLAPEIAEAIEVAARELADGYFDDHFPLPVWQTGSGTQTNMNANEVIANRANELFGQPLGSRSPVHPNDHVNCSQSSNDSFPTVMHVAAAIEVRQMLIPALGELRDILAAKAKAFDRVLKIGRTHLMDAVPMTMGQAFDAFARQVGAGLDRLAAVMPRLCLLPQGGSAVGSGLNVPRGFDRLFCQEIAELTNINFRPNPSKFEGMGAHDAFVELSGALNTICVSLLKILNDIRFLASGPRCGLGELILPDDGLSSSIMPGKRNPTVAEAAIQAVHQIMGNHNTITLAAASGSFELNVAKPVILYNILQSIDLMAGAARLVGPNLIQGLEVDIRRLATNVEGSLLLATVLNPVLGYDKVAKITAKAMADDLTPRQAAVALDFMTSEEFDRLVDPMRMARSEPD